MYVTKKKRTKKESNNNFHNEIKLNAKINAIKICCNNIEMRFWSKFCWLKVGKFCLNNENHPIRYIYIYQNIKIEKHNTI